MRLLFIGDLRPGRTGGQRCAAARRLGHEVFEVDTSRLAARSTYPRLRSLVNKVAVRTTYELDVFGVTAEALEVARREDVDALWLDKVLCLPPKFFEMFKADRPDRRIVFYHPDDFRSRFNWSRRYTMAQTGIDLIATTKSYNVPEYRDYGFEHVLFLNKSFDPREHCPPDGYDPSQRRTEFDHDVGFVGGYERERAEMIAELGVRGIDVHVAGSFWDRARRLPANVFVEHGDLGVGAYARRIHRTKINLAFLRKQNRDLQTARSFEIPACGGFMLSESTDELRRLFEPGVEAEFFSSFDELYEKCRRYLADDVARESIALQGCRHVWEGPYQTDDVVRACLDTAFGL